MINEQSFKYILKIIDTCDVRTNEDINIMKTCRYCKKIFKRNDE